MNRREKLLAGAVGGILGLFVVGFALHAFINKPLKEIDRRTTALRDRLEKIKGERRAFFAAEDGMKALTLRTFDDTVDQASAKSGEMITRTILSSGLSEAEFTRLPFGPRKLQGASEMGWSIQGEGPLSNVVNLVFRLQESPWLHKLDSLSVAAGDLPGLVKVRFRFLTLVMDPSPEVTRKELPPGADLESPNRRLLDGLVARDLLRPYIKRPPPPPPPEPGQRPASRPTSPSSPPGPESFRVVSLSEWLGQPEVHVRDLVNQKTMRYKTGDALAGGLVMSVDYRPMPIPGTGGMLSSSRVILKIGADLWAVDRGRTLADKRKLTQADLPAELLKRP